MPLPACPAGPEARWDKPTAAPAKLNLDSPLDYSNAGANDYIDFLADGRLEWRVLNSDANVITQETTIKNLIKGGYFRSSYSYSDLDGTDPNTGESVQIVYKKVNGGTNWQVELGIADTPCSTPQYADLDDDCDVDVDDLVIMSTNWLDATGYVLGDIADSSGDFIPTPDGKVDLYDFAVLASEWLSP